jgi:site-specific recombinase XerD
VGDQFLKDAQARNLSNGTLRLYKLLFRELAEFGKDRGIQYVNGFDLEALTDFRAGWKISPLTASRKLERLRGIFKFAPQRKMVEENFAVGLVGPKLKQNPTLPFPKAEMDKILKAAESDDVDPPSKGIDLNGAPLWAPHLRRCNACGGELEGQSLETV